MPNVAAQCQEPHGGQRWRTTLAWVASAAGGFLVLGGLVLLALGGRLAALRSHVSGIDVLHDAALGAVWAALLGATIPAWAPRQDRWALLLLWAAKIVVGLGAMPFYESHYTTLDSHSYFSLARAGAHDWQVGSLAGGTDNTIAVSWLVQQLVGPSYASVKLFFSFAGMIGIYLTALAWRRASGRGGAALVLLIGFFPSVLFWSSILGKDPLILLGIGVFAMGVAHAFGQHWRRGVPLCIAGVAWTWMVRPWMALILLAPLAAVLGAIALRTRRGMVRAAAVAAALACTAGLWFIALQTGIHDPASALETLNRWSHAWAAGGSSQEAPTFRSFLDVLFFVPMGAFTALFRPLPGEVLDPLVFGLLAGLDNLALLCLTAATAWRWRRSRGRGGDFRAWAVWTVALWSLFYAFISYQNLGSAVRFRLQVTPLMLGLLLSTMARPRISTQGRPLRVLHIITGLSYGGAESMLEKLLLHRDRQGVEAHVISLTGRGDLAGRLEAAGVPVRCLGLRRAAPNPLAFLRLAWWIRRTRPDLVQTWMYHADLVGGVAARAAGCRAILWSIRQSALGRQENRPLSYATMRACAWLSRIVPARIVSCSERAAISHAAFGYPHERIVTIPNGFDTQEFHPQEGKGAEVREHLAIDASAPVVGLVARYDPLKDHATFLRAAARLAAARPEVRFVLCGSGIDDENAALAATIRDTGVSPASLRLLGARADLASLMPGFDVLALSSVQEGFPNVLGEAMSCGVPCAATDAGDSAQVVGDTGRIVPPRDPEALAAAVEDLLRLPDAQRRALGARARRRIQDHFEIRAIVKRYEALYQEVAAACAASPAS